MVRQFILTICLALSLNTLQAQQVNLVIDSTAINNWPELFSASISNDGKYIAYQVNTKETNSGRLIIRSTDGQWQQAYKAAIFVAFSGDNKQAILQRKDSLIFLKTGGRMPYRSIVITSFAVRNQRWVLYTEKKQPDTFRILDFLNAKETYIDSVSGFKADADDQPVLLITHENGKSALKKLDLATGQQTFIYSAAQNAFTFSPSDCKFDKSGKQICFMMGVKEKSLWYSSGGQASKLANDQNIGIKRGLKINGTPEFSNNGRFIFFSLQYQPDTSHHLSADNAQVDVYHYRDAELQSQQLNHVHDVAIYDAAISVNGGNVVQLEDTAAGHANLWTRPELVTGDQVVVGEHHDEDFKPSWLAYPSTGWKIYLVSLIDGSRKLLMQTSAFPVSGFSFSGNGEYLLYWDSRFAAYLSYNLETQKTINLTHTIEDMAKSPTYINSFGNSLFAQNYNNYNEKWLADGKTFLVYAKYDIWKIDPTGANPPICLTKGYGAKHHTLLRLVDERQILNGDATVLLTGFNEDNKDNGFFSLPLNRPTDLKLLTMGPYDYYRSDLQLPSPRNSFAFERPPVKAKEAEAWILSRQTADAFPNLFYTRDWKTIKPITDIRPQQSFRWLTSDLINYKQLNGTPQQGILYKPTDFNPKKKYPVIFNYYEQLSYRLHEYPTPDYTGHNINIPWFVSRGYLVFTPDVSFERASIRKGKTVGESAVNSVVGAAKWLSKLSYVDSKHMGIQGHSFGGGETNYIVTHSNLFAAAASAGGTVSDQVSAYLGLFRPKGREPNANRIAHSENGHEMIGTTLWERPDLYFRSSSVFNANKVTTPLLLMHNEEDGQTDWGQSFELFNALRRLGKPAWLLQYDHEGHVLIKAEDQKDYTIRLTQFFDHYLKGKLAPKWMVDGVPASMKGVDQGYELMPNTKNK